MTMQIVATIFLLILSAWTTKCDDVNGQKAHFQVKNKEVGKLEIHATKKSAKITAVADSVNMLVQPGTETAHLKEEAKKSGKDKSGKKEKENKRTLFLSKHFLNSFLKSRAPAQKSITENNKAGGKYATQENTKKSSYPTHGNEKKSSIDQEMKVHGQAGALKVHTDHNLTAVTSESGNLEVFIKNPEKEKEVVLNPNLSSSKYTFKKDTEARPQSVGASPDTAYKQVHLPVHIIEDVNGLKKSVVTKKNHLKKSNLDLKWKKLNHAACVIPPCTPRD